MSTVAAPAAAAQGPAPGAPGEKAIWTEADKDGFGTATGLASKAWFTLDDGRLTEVYYPDLGTPALRDLQFVVSDGRRFSEREQDSTRQRVRLLDSRSLSYRQVNTDRQGLYRIVKTYTTDPARSSVLVDVRFQSLTRRPLRLYVLHDPALSNNGDDDSGATRGRALVAWDAQAASALVASRPFRRTSSGFLGVSDGWTDLKDDHRMNWRYNPATGGNVVQTARTRLNGRRRQTMTLSLGFGADRASALATARASLGRGFARAHRAYSAGWHDYIAGLRPKPASARPYGPAYWVSAMVLSAAEDKTNRGAHIASPSMPWAWGLLTIDEISAAYHLVWPRDLYQVATAQIALGDRAAANRLLDFTFLRQQKADGSFPQNTRVDGAENWTNLQMDEVALPIVLAWQLRRFGGSLYNDHIKKAASFIAANGPFSPQERWENQDGWSPGTIAAEIAGLVCAADIARRNGDAASAQAWEALADGWQASVERWTATTNGPYNPKPYYLRLTKGENPDPNAGTTYSIGDGGPSAADQRTVVDPSFLRARAPRRQGLRRSDGAQHDPGGGPAAGRAHPERHLLASLQLRRLRRDPQRRALGHHRSGHVHHDRPDLADLRRRAGRVRAAGGQAPSGRPASGRDGGRRQRGLDDRGAGVGRQSALGPAGLPAGEGTLSATPLSWSHAQFIRLARSIDAGRPVEQPSIVARRYAAAQGPAMPRASSR